MLLLLANGQPMKDKIVIKSEADAFALLEKVTKDKNFHLPPDSIQFSGWPVLTIHLTGEKFNQSITPTLMKAFIAFQDEIYRSYAIAKYGKETISSLTNDEKKELEIVIMVKSGSSDTLIDLTEVAKHFVDMAGNNMTGSEIIALALGAGLIWAGKTIAMKYLDDLKDKRSRESSSEDLKNHLDTVKFMTEEQTRRAEFFANLVDGNHKLQRMQERSVDAKHAIIKGIATAEKAEFLGKKIDPYDAEELCKVAKRKSIDAVINADYHIEKVDSSNPNYFMVKLRNSRDDETINAKIEIKPTNKQQRELLKEAEWNHKILHIQMDAKELDSNIRNAIITHVDSVEDDE